MLLRSSGSNWFVRLLPINGQVSIAVEQYSLTQDRLVNRKNSRAIVNLNKVSDVANAIEDDSKLIGFTVSQNVTVSGDPASEILKRPKECRDSDDIP